MRRPWQLCSKPPCSFMHALRASSPAWLKGGCPRSWNRGMVSARSSLRKRCRARVRLIMVTCVGGGRRVGWVRCKGEWRGDERGKRSGVDDVVAIALVGRAEGMTVLGVAPAAAEPGAHGVGRKDNLLVLEPVGGIGPQVVGHERKSFKKD